MFSHILCPVDGSQPSMQALDVAAKLAAEQHATLTICNVADPAKASAMAFGDPGMSAACFEALEAEAKTTVSEAAQRVRGTTAARTQTLDGPASGSILDCAVANACDLIVIGSHGRTGISRAIMGSVAEGVLRHSTVPVMVVHWTRTPAVA